MAGPLFTRAQYDLLPEGFPAQLIEGYLVKQAGPTYGHNRIGARIRAALLPLVGPDRLPLTPSDVAVDDFNVFQPDIVVIAEPVDDDTSYVGVPQIAIEILSPSTRNVDRNIKADRLIEIGVAEVWLVDANARTIEVRTEAGHAFARGTKHATSQAVPGFRLCPDELFTPPSGRVAR